MNLVPNGQLTIVTSLGQVTECPEAAATLPSTDIIAKSSLVLLEEQKKVLVFGGARLASSGLRGSAEVYSYDMQMNTWTLLNQTMKKERIDPTAIAIGKGKVLIVGNLLG